MTDWLAFARQITADLDVVLAEHPTRLEREPVVGAGEGGDETTAIDAAAERAVVARLEELAATGVEFTLVSEELGERSFGAETPRLVLDPIDGSMNAKRGVPFFSVSLAVAEGPTMADVLFGYVFDFGTREEWTARRGEGAFLNGAPLTGPGPKEDVEILSFEATLTDSIAQQIGDMVGFAPRTRVMGSLALTLCHMAAGRVDAVCSLKPARSVDIAAAQLLVLERGLAIDLPDRPPYAEAPLDVSPHSRVVAAATPELCAELYRRLSAERLRRSSRFCRTTGHSSSVTEYQAESRRAPSRTSMCLRKMPSNRAGSASSAARERSFSASVLNSTRMQASSSNACPMRRSLASTFAPVPQAALESHVQPISSPRCSGRRAR